jgi:hypothetical protein
VHTFIIIIIIIIINSSIVIPALFHFRVFFSLHLSLLDVILCCHLQYINTLTRQCLNYSFVIDVVFTFIHNPQLCHINCIYLVLLLLHRLIFTHKNIICCWIKRFLPLFHLFFIELLLNYNCQNNTQ